MRIAFFIAIALVAYMLWRDFGRREIGMWDARRQWVFYGAAGLFLVDAGWFFVTSLVGPKRARVLRRRGRLHLCGRAHLARAAQKYS